MCIGAGSVVERLKFGRTKRFPFFAEWKKGAGRYCREYEELLIHLADSSIRLIPGAENREFIIGSASSKPCGRSCISARKTNCSQIFFSRFFSLLRTDFRLDGHGTFPIRLARARKIQNGGLCRKGFRSRLVFNEHRTSVFKIKLSNVNTNF